MVLSDVDQNRRVCIWEIQLESKSLLLLLKSNQLIDLLRINGL